MNALSRRSNRPGFTLIELLLVIAIISILAAIVIIAINPARQIAQANNAQRRSNVSTILNAVHEYSVDNRGALPTTIPTSTTPICMTGVTSTSCVDLSVLTNNELYLTSIPTDPTSAASPLTGYSIRKSTSTNPRVTVSAPDAELSETITVTQ